MTTGLEELQAFAQWLEEHFALHEQEWTRMRAARAAGQVPVPDPWWTDQDCAYVALRAQIDTIRRIKLQTELRLRVLQGEADLETVGQEAAQERAEEYARWLATGARSQGPDSTEGDE